MSMTSCMQLTQNAHCGSVNPVSFKSALWYAISAKVVWSWSYSCLTSLTYKCCTAECPSNIWLTDSSSSMAGALPPVAGNGHRLSFIQPKLAGCSQRLEANTKQQSFHFQWAIAQQHLGKGPCETSPSFFIKQWWLHQPQLAHPTMGSKHEWHSVLHCWFRARKRNLFHPPTPPLSFFLFANDAEIWNHFAFSVIMNIWCTPSGHVVIWWAWPWLLVQKTDIDI